MSPVLLCFGALDAAVIAQAAYAVRELRSGEAEEAREGSPAERD
ncbi:MAG: hypothetical protein R2718_03660 [Solirubrobacterales bacterium]